MPLHPARPSADARLWAGAAGWAESRRVNATSFPIVAIGASAGGLEACQKLFDGLPAEPAMAFILVQHLDPTHVSMLVDLLSAHTKMPVVQAEDGAVLEPGHVYVIAPGTYLGVAAGALVVSKPQARHGARLPFDFLLNSLAETHGARTICVVLSGSGDDGSLGLKAVKAAGGAVIAQDPDEAAYDGMPRCAILTGGVDVVSSVGRIPEAIVAAAAKQSLGHERADAVAVPSDVVLPGIVGLVRQVTAQDFSLYKPGTLHRRIQRRMALAATPTDRMDAYLDRLRGDSAEVGVLAKDLLIHVTSFFRDPKAFELLAATIVPEMVRARAAGDPIRIWIPACSTGEEAYSLAMLFREEIAAAGGDIKLQLFGSDVDADVVATAREGFYSEEAVAGVSPARLARFFTREDHGYRIAPELRAAVVFTTQNVLTEPPFSRLDLISCRNLLIYLRPEAQTKVVGIFHFALRPGGVLMLGGSETVGPADGRFEVISKAARLYRQVGRARPADFALAADVGKLTRGATRPSPLSAASQPSLAELCRRMVLEAHAPAAVLVNKARECLYSLGPTDRYLKVPAGAPSLDLLAMARTGVRAKLASAITQAFESDAIVTVHAGPLRREGIVHAFQIEARPLKVAGESLLLLCFLDAPPRASGAGKAGTVADSARIDELEAELAAAKVELQSAMRGLEISTEEQTSINEEALSVNEEFQSTNEELLTSKEELQSLNEELSALNTQLQETLERQRTTATDLQNILYSTDVAIAFLDNDLCIRFFTPATRALFNIMPADVGRPLADLRALAPDDKLIDDARGVLAKTPAMDREIETADGVWYVRRLMPYRNQAGAVEGVVITYADVTERRQTARRLQAATQIADNANRAKSRFLAAASHDLRQPLQTLTLIQGLLERKAQGEPERKLIALQQQCLIAMSGMLNTLLDINQIDAGVVKASVVDFSINTVFEKLAGEFTHAAAAKGLRLRVAPCGIIVRSDPALLEQMIRNLLANAIKYTAKGKVLLGCRRRAGYVQIQVLDTGVGMAASELKLIFEEYHQIENEARERSQGLGLGLSIVKRLGDLLGHEVGVHSLPRRGSVFAIDVVRADVAAGPHSESLPRAPTPPALPPSPVRLIAAILVVEDDPEVRELLRLVLEDEGHAVMTAVDGHAALAIVDQGKVRPDICLADFNLPGGMTGLELASRLRARLGASVPVVMLTGDISAETLREIGLENWIPLYKPVQSDILSQVIQGQLAEADVRGPLVAGAPPADLVRRSTTATVFLVDDDAAVREAIGLVLEAEGMHVRSYPDCESFLAAFRPGQPGCLLIDAYLPGGMTGLALLGRLREMGDPLPAIMITGEADVQIAVQAMKAGAADFIEKPITGPELLGSIEKVLEGWRDSSKLAAAQAGAAEQIGKLTGRQAEILAMVLAGHPSKNIAADLGISQRTVENHRAAIMRRTSTKSLPALARLAVAAAGKP